jgi:hypothetical protein
MPSSGFAVPVVAKEECNVRCFFYKVAVQPGMTRKTAHLRIFTLSVMLNTLIIFFRSVVNGTFCSSVKKRCH